VTGKQLTLENSPASTIPANIAITGSKSEPISKTVEIMNTCEPDTADV
jgi:hypothetical protein